MGRSFLFVDIGGRLHEAITDVEGIEVGHHTDVGNGTGCTVVLCRNGAIGGVEVRGGGPGTHETDLLRPGNLIQRMHAALLTGGSAFGLAAAAGVMRYLEEHEVGFPMGQTRVPIVPAAVLFDLNLIQGSVRPGPDEGYQACQNASSGPVDEGSVGAGTGATVGKALGISSSIKGGIGTASVALGRGITIGALVAVNAYGSVVDHGDTRIIAGPRRLGYAGFANTVELLLQGKQPGAAPLPGNTSIGVVATNAPLDKEQANFLARVAHDGLALTIRPCHTIRDGDTLFAMATGTVRARPDLTQLGAAAVEAVARSVLRAIRMAQGLGGIPSALEWAGE